MALLRNPRLRRAWLVAGVVVVPAGLAALFVLLVRRLPLVELSETAGVVTASFALALAGYALFARRLARVLEAFFIRLPRASVWRIHLSSLFYYFFLPAGIGYDFSKVAKIALQAPREGGGRVTLAVAAERLAGGAGVYLLLLASLPFTRMVPDSRLEWLTPPDWAWPPLVAVVPLAAWLIARGARRRRDYRAGPLVHAVAVAAFAHLAIAGAVWFVATSLDIGVSFPEIVVALAATLLFQLLPVNFLGVTLGEVAAVSVYLAYGLARPEALLLTAVAYAHRLVAAMVGGGIEVAGAWQALRAERGAPGRGAGWGVRS